MKPPIKAMGGFRLERVMGFEPMISTLGKSHVATTLNPHIFR